MQNSSLEVLGIIIERQKKRASPKAGLVECGLVCYDTSGGGTDTSELATDEAFLATSKTSFVHALSIRISNGILVRVERLRVNS